MSICSSQAFLLLVSVQIVYLLISVPTPTSALYSTKTHYYDSFSAQQLDFINNEENYKIPSCSADQIYILARHGSRYPSTKQGQVTRGFLENVKKFVNNAASPLHKIVDSFKDKPHYGLTELGAMEMREIGKRFRTRYPNLFANFEAEKHSFMSSSKSRSIESGTNFTFAAFADETTPESHHNTILRHFEISDKMLRGFDSCKRYVNEIKDNEEATKEIHNFKRSEAVRNMINNFKKRHFIDDSYDLSIDIVHDIGTLCDIENAHNMTKNWCKLLSNDDMNIVGYLNDLKSYWVKSHGSKVNSYVTCGLLTELVDELEKHINLHENRKTVLLRFGHAENIIPFISAFNLYKDDIFDGMAHRYEEMHERAFKNSKISPFSSNVAFVLLKCNGEHGNFEYKVKVLLNELPMRLIKAGNLQCEKKQNLNDDHSVCDFQTFKKSLIEGIECFSNPFVCDNDDKGEL